MPDPTQQMITSPATGTAPSAAVSMIASTPSGAPAAPSNGVSLPPDVMSAIGSAQPASDPYDFHAKNKALDFFVQLGRIQSGLAAKDMQFKLQQRMNQAEIMHSAIQNNPELVRSPDFMKTFAGLTTPEMAKAVGGLGQAELLRRQHAAQNVSGALDVLGPQGAPDAGTAMIAQGSPGAPRHSDATPGGAMPTGGGFSGAGGGGDLRSLIEQEQRRNDRIRAKISQLQQQMIADPSLAAQYKPVVDVLTKDYEEHRRLIDRYAVEATRPGVAGAEETARQRARTSPEAIAGEARLAGARSSAEAQARRRATASYANLQSELRDMSPAKKIEKIQQLYNGMYPKKPGAGGWQLVPDPVRPGQTKLAMVDEGADARPSLQEFARHLGVDLSTGEMMAAAPTRAAAPPAGGVPAAPAAPAPPAIVIPGKGRGTPVGTTADGLPIYEFPDGSRMSVKRSAMAKLGR